MSIKKIALIVGLGIVAALSIRSLQANPFTSLFTRFGINTPDPVQPIVEATQKEAVTVIKEVGDAVTTNASEVINNTAKIVTEKGIETLHQVGQGVLNQAQQTLAKESLEGAANVTLQSTEGLIKEGADKIVKDPNLGIALLKRLYTLAQDHPKMSATIGTVGVLSTIAYFLWRDHNIDHLATLWGYIQADFYNKRNEHKGLALQKVNCRYRTWMFRKNQTLILNVERFYNTDPHNDDDRRRYADLIRNECFNYYFRFIHSWWIS